MKKREKLVVSSLFAGIFCTLFSGCASIVNGTKQTVSFNSNPPGAKIYLDGAQIGVTPYVCEISRGDCPEIVMKKDGYAPERLKMTDSIDAAAYFGGNLGLCLLWIVPGVVGFIADPVTGGMWEYDFPNVNLELSPERVLSTPKAKK